MEKGLEKYKTMPHNNSLRGVCNSFICSQKYMSEINPNMYFLIDSKFIGGFLRTVTADICNYVKNNDCYLFVPDHWVPLFINKFDIKDKIIGLELDAENINFPTVENFKLFTKATNVIPTMAIPVISHYVKKIYIMGCDGQDSKDIPIWTHPEGLEALALIKFEGARNIIDLIDYLYRHEMNYERVVEYGESLGVKYESLTPSYIPCLMERYKG